MIMLGGGRNGDPRAAASRLVLEATGMSLTQAYASVATTKTPPTSATKKGSGHIGNRTPTPTRKQREASPSATPTQHQQSSDAANQVWMHSKDIECCIFHVLAVREHKNAGAIPFHRSGPISPIRLAHFRPLQMRCLFRNLLFRLKNILMRWRLAHSRRAESYGRLSNQQR